MNSDFKILKQKLLPDSEMEIEGEISVSEIEAHRKEALQKLGSKMEIAGFRKGHIPEKVLIDRVGELGVLEEAASLAIEHLYLKIIEEAKINPIGRPQVSITKLAAGNPLGFKIKTAVLPEIKLPDYKKLAQGVKKESVSEVTEPKFEEALKRFGELTTDSIKKFGDFKDVDDFKNKVRENLKLEKEIKNREKYRLSILDKIIEKTRVEIPKVLIESEQEKMLAQFKGNVASMGLKPEDYFKQINKTEPQLKEEGRADAEKRAKMELILYKIAAEEKIEVSKEAIDKETEHILSHYKDADPLRARLYVEQMLTNEMVWRFLEEQK